MPGSIETVAVASSVASVPSGVFGTTLSTAFWAAACAFGSSVVRMVRPPWNSRALRSSRVAPNAGSSWASLRM